MKRAPADLKSATRKWVNDCLKTWELDQHQQRLLLLAAQVWDRGQQVRAILEKVGITCLDRYGATKTHPAVAVERDSQLQFARLLRELQLDVSVPEETRSPGLYK